MDLHERTGASQDCAIFSKVSSTIILHSKLRSGLTFENFDTVDLLERTGASQDGAVFVSIHTKNARAGKISQE